MELLWDAIAELRNRGNGEMGNCGNGRQGRIHSVLGEMDPPGNVKKKML